MLRSDFFIARDVQCSALEQIKKLNPIEWCEIIGNIQPHFSFVKTEQYQQADTLMDALKAWRWLIEFDDDDNIHYIEFLGEKLGDDEILFTSIAPFVRHGSYIQMAGDDGEIWRWYFSNGCVNKQKGKVIFE